MEASSSPKMSQNQNCFYFFLVLLLIALMAARTPIDSDMWWHLRAGEDTLKTGSPILIDSYSFTRFGTSWINHSWLAQVIFYLFYQVGNFWGISFLVVVLAAASMGFTYAQMDGFPILRAFLLVIGSLVAAVVWVPRPQMFSLLLLAVVSWILFLYRFRKINRLWLLPPVFLFWSNLHGGYPLGFFFLAVVLIGDGINQLRFFRVTPFVELKSIARLSGVLLICLPVVLINPNGIQMWLVPFQTLDVEILRNFISEWASPDFHQLYQQPFLWLLLFFIVLQGLAGRKLHPLDLLVVITFTYLGLTARRNYAPFTIAVLPIVSRLLDDIIRQSFTMGRPEEDVKFQSFPNRFKWINLTIIGLLTVFVIAKGYVTAHPVIVDYFERQSYPKDAVRWLEQEKPIGNLFNSYNWGGYLIWSLPSYPVYVDGRTDLFGDQILKDWMKVMNVEKGRQEVLDRWEIKLVLVEADQPLTTILELEGWKRIYQDQIALIYER